MGDTIKPRLVEAGADLSRVMVIDDTEEALTLSDDRIEKAVRQNHVRFVIIDPVQAFIGADVDMNRANEVRPVFRKLGMIAEKTGCAIVMIGHLNKSSGTQRFMKKVLLHHQGKQWHLNWETKKDFDGWEPMRFPQMNC